MVSNHRSQDVWILLQCCQVIFDICVAVVLFRYLGQDNRRNNVEELSKYGNEAVLLSQGNTTTSLKEYEDTISLQKLEPSHRDIDPVLYRENECLLSD